MARTIVARTDRLFLREWEEGDEKVFYDALNTPAVMKNLGGVQDWETWRKAKARIDGFSRDFGHTFWIVEDQASGELLGFCGLKRVNTPGAGDLSGTPEIGWRLRQSAWGKGIAKEAAIAALDQAFERFGYPSVIALTVPANRDSLGLMKRLGMTLRDDLQFTDTRYGPEFNPVIVYQMTAREWPAARALARGLKAKPGA